jgi:ankyrin repeat protein
MTRVATEKRIDSKMKHVTWKHWIVVLTFGQAIVSVTMHKEASAIMEGKVYFKGAQLKLADAILTDRQEAIDQAVSAGALVDGPGAEGVTPCMFALVSQKKSAVEKLLKRGADPNKRAKNEENAVTLAVRLAPQDLDYLELVLQHGGNPDTLESD